MRENWIVNGRTRRIVLASASASASGILCGKCQDDTPLHYDKRNTHKRAARVIYAPIGMLFSRLPAGRAATL